MRETEYELFQTYTATVGANGIATIDAVGPVQPFERWEITSTQVANNGANATKLEVFNNMSRTQLVEGSQAGRLDTSDSRYNLRSGQALYYRWSGGSVGSLCNLSVRGSKFIAGDRGGGIR